MLRKILFVAVIVFGSLLLLASAGVAVLYFTHTGDQAVQETTADNPTLPALDLGSYRFHAETYGNPDHPVVITLHGGPGGDYRSILPLKRLADAGYFVVFYDQRGSGLSPRVAADELTLDRFIADLDLFVEYYGQGRPVHIVGHSWGAMLASAYIGRFPGKVDDAVLIEPGMLDDTHMQKFYDMTGLQDLKPNRSIVINLMGAWAESLHITGPDEQARNDYFLNAFFTTPTDDNPLGDYYPGGTIENAAGEYWRFGSLASSEIPKSGLDAQGRLIDLTSGIEKWEGTALFMAGSENRIIGPEFQRSQMAKFARARLAVVQGAGHTMVGEKPEESLRIISDFLHGPDKQNES